MAYDSKLITGVILAGGQATRMGGNDKGLSLLAGKPMIEYVIACMTPQVGNLLINANRSEAAYQQYGFPVIHDLTANFAGPLAGIAAAMAHTSSELLLTAPCDSPCLPKDLAERLYRQLTATDADVCVAHDGNQLQPVFGLFHQRLTPGIQQFLDSGDRKLKLWLQTQKLAVADFSDCPDAFTNVNTPAERERLELQLSDSSG